MKPDFPADRKLNEQLNELERKIDQAVELLSRLRRENRELQEKIARLEKLRQTLINQLNTIIDKIDSLL
ncbi:MAG: hypothetical protein ABIK22_02290 [candidate division WOR-3 bacterium]